MLLKRRTYRKKNNTKGRYYAGVQKMRCEARCKDGSDCLNVTFSPNSRYCWRHNSTQYHRSVEGRIDELESKVRSLEIGFKGLFKLSKK